MAQYNATHPQVGHRPIQYNLNDGGVKQRLDYLSDKRPENLVNA